MGQHYCYGLGYKLPACSPIFLMQTKDSQEQKTKLIYSPFIFSK